MHEVATLVTALAAQVAHLIAFVNPAQILPPIW
jgi:hypothetical protein